MGTQKTSPFHRSRLESPGWTISSGEVWPRTGFTLSKETRVPERRRWRFQYLLSGVAKGEKTLCVTLSETREELEAVAASHGWSLAGIEIIELVPSEVDLEPDNQYTMFKPADLELGATTKLILSEIDRDKPARMVIDSLSEMRLLAQNALRYRRQVLAFKQFFTGRRCTVLFLDDLTSEVVDLQLQSIAHGVIRLEQLSPEYGAERRRLRVIKLRGRKFRGGYHDFTIGRGGLNVFPRLVAADHQPADRAASPVEEWHRRARRADRGRDRTRDQPFSCSVRPAAASHHWPSSSPCPPRCVASVPRCSSSTRGSKRFTREQPE